MIAAEKSQELQKQSWKELASIQVGGAICLPLLIVGYELAKQGHPLSLLFSIVWGNLLLFGFALIAVYMSKKRGVTTVEQASFYFGPAGRKFFALTLAGSMLGWFAIQTQCMGNDLYHLMHPFVGETAGFKEIVTIGLAMLIVAGAFWGLNFFAWMSHVCIPLLIGTIGFAVYTSGDFSWSAASGISSFPALWDGNGVSLVLASSMAATIDLPTFYRHAHSPGGAIAASMANYLVAMPLVQVAGMGLYYGTHAPTITEALSIDSFMIWKVWVVCFMLLAGWTTNNLNLYSASLSLKSLSKSFTFSKAMWLAGSAGCLLVLFPILDKFALALDLMGIFVVAMGGVMFGAFIFEQIDLQLRFFGVWTAWIVGISAGLIPLIWPQWGSGAPVLDAGVASILSLVLIVLYQLRIEFEKECGR